MTTDRTSARARIARRIGPAAAAGAALLALAPVDPSGGARADDTAMASRETDALGRDGNDRERGPTLHAGDVVVGWIPPAGVTIAPSRPAGAGRVCITGIRGTGPEPVSMDFRRHVLATAGACITRMLTGDRVKARLGGRARIAPVTGRQPEAGP